MSGAQWALRIGAAVLALLLLGMAIWWLFIRPGQMADDAARAKGDAVVATGQAAAAKDATGIIEKHFTERERIERVTIQGSQIIAAAPGAGDRIPDAVHRAGLRALCLHADYRGSAPCQQLHDADSADAAPADAGRNPAGAGR